MNNYKKSVRTHLIIMVIIYGGTWFILNNIVMQQQQRILQAYREKRAKLEYNYLKIRNYPEQERIIQQTINKAKEKLYNFVWLASEFDPNLAFYKHISEISQRSGVQIDSLRPVNQENAKYYSWEITMKGSFPGIFNLIKQIETSPRFLRIDSIEISSTNQGLQFITKVTGIKKLE